MGNKALGWLGDVAIATAIAIPISLYVMSKNQEPEIVTQSVNEKPAVVLEEERRNFSGCNPGGDGYVVITSTTKDYLKNLRMETKTIKEPCNQYNLQTGERLNGN